MNHKTVKIAETRRIILHQSVANKCPHELRTATSVLNLYNSNLRAVPSFFK